MELPPTAVPLARRRLPITVSTSRHEYKRVVPGPPERAGAIPPKRMTSARAESGVSPQRNAFQPASPHGPAPGKLIADVAGVNR